MTHCYSPWQLQLGDACLHLGMWSLRDPFWKALSQIDVWCFPLHLAQVPWLLHSSGLCFQSVKLKHSLLSTRNVFLCHCQQWRAGNCICMSRFCDLSFIFWDQEVSVRQIFVTGFFEPGSVWVESSKLFQEIQRTSLVFTQLLSVARQNDVFYLQRVCLLTVIAK